MGLFSPQIATKKLVPLCRQLATSYDAGIPIVRSLELVSAKVKDRRTREVMEGMRDSIRRGTTLGDAAFSQQKYLPPFFVHLLATGEKGGRLDLMLRDLADYFEDRLEMQRKMIGMLILPGLELYAAWWLGLFALKLIGKQKGGLDSEFARSGIDGVIQFAKDYVVWQGVMHLFFLGLFVIAVFLSRAGLFGYIWGLFSTFIWPVATVTRKFAMARFYRSFSLLVGSGLNIVNCLESAATVAANPYITNDLLKGVPVLKKGGALTEALSHSKYVSSTAREMILVGEETGNLDAQLRKVANYLMEEAQYAMHMLTRVVGVLIVLGVGILVGYIVISFYMTYLGNIDALIN